MAYEKISFSRAGLAGLPPAPAGKRVYFSDAKEPGLLLCVTAVGSKSFQVYVKVSGRPVRVTLGRFNQALADSIELPRDCSYNDFLANTPELNIRMARALAARVKIDLKAGLNPADTKRAKRSEMTLGELFEEYVERHLIPYKKKGIDTSRANFQRYFGALPDEPRRKHGKLRAKTKGSVNWQNRPIGNITKADVRRVILDLGREGSHCTANRALGLIRSMYNRASEWGLFDKPNPAAGITKFKTKSRERFLVSDELPRFFEAVAQETNQDIRDYILLSLLTGARKSNVLGMCWADLNLDRALWTVRGEESKNGDPMVVPLMPEALAILRNRKPDEAVEFVFPGRGKSGHLQGAKAGWQRVLDRAELGELTKRIQEAGHTFEWPALRPKVIGPRGLTRGPIYESLTTSLARARETAAALKLDTNGARLDDLRIHDMRRTLGSWQAATGASLVVIGKSLGHKSTQATEVYSRLNLDPVRDSMQTATRAMLAAGGLIQTAEIVPLKKTA
jgi:integrase